MKARIYDQVLKLGHKIYIINSVIIGVFYFSWLTKQTPSLKLCREVRIQSKSNMYNFILLQCLSIPTSPSMSWKGNLGIKMEQHVCPLQIWRKNSDLYSLPSLLIGDYLIQPCEWYESVLSKKDKLMMVNSKVRKWVEI